MSQKKHCALHKMVLILLCTILASLSLALPNKYETALPDLGDNDRTNLTPTEADFLGKQVIDDIQNQGAMIDDYDTLYYLNNLGNNLASYSTLAGEHFSFYLIKGNEINAFALPGGYICIYNGLIYNTLSEAELSSVMSHEIGHIIQHHIFRNIGVYSRNQWLSLAGILAGGLLAAVNPAAAIVAANAGGGMALQNILSFSRDFEREADRVGQKLMYSAQFDPHAMPDFFARLKKVNQFNDNEAYAFLRTHPVTSERISEAQERANQLHVKMHPDSTSFLIIREKARVRQLKPSPAINFYKNAIADKKYTSLDAQYYGLAYAYFLNQSFAQSLTQLNKIIAPEFINHPAILSLKGRDLAGLKQFTLSEAVYEKGLNDYPNYKNLWAGELELYLYSKQYKKANLKLDTLLQLYPNDINLWAYAASLYSDSNLNLPKKYYYALGNAQFLLGKYKDALIQYQNALAIKSKTDPSLNDIILSKIIDTTGKIKTLNQFTN